MSGSRERSFTFFGTKARNNSLESSIFVYSFLRPAPNPSCTPRLLSGVLTSGPVAPRPPLPPSPSVGGTPTPARRNSSARPSPRHIPPPAPRLALRHAPPDPPPACLARRPTPHLQTSPLRRKRVRLSGFSDGDLGRVCVGCHRVWVGKESVLCFHFHWGFSLWSSSDSDYNWSSSTHPHASATLNIISCSWSSNNGCGSSGYLGSSSRSASIHGPDFSPRPESQGRPRPGSRGRRGGGRVIGTGGDAKGLMYRAAAARTARLRESNAAPSAARGVTHPNPEAADEIGNT